MDYNAIVTITIVLIKQKTREAKNKKNSNIMDNRLSVKSEL